MKTERERKRERESERERESNIKGWHNPTRPAPTDGARIGDGYLFT